MNRTLKEQTRLKQIKKNAISYYKTYCNLVDDMNEFGGFIHPIRAIVKIYKDTSIQKVVADAMDTQAISDFGELACKKDAIELFMHKSSIVGYFGTRRLDEDTIIVGFSMCRPSDYGMFQKHISIVHALLGEGVVDDLSSFEIDDMRTFFDNLECAQPLSSKVDRKFIIEPTNNGEFVVYFFPFPISEQFTDFVRRCRRYYKVGE